jgi:hypothetical protein
MRNANQIAIFSYQTSPGSEHSNRDTLARFAADLIKHGRKGPSIKMLEDSTFIWKE